MMALIGVNDASFSIVDFTTIGTLLHRVSIVFPLRHFRLIDLFVAKYKGHVFAQVCSNVY
jgi:hypothetical protein